MDGQRKALIIANDEYTHAQLRNLTAPAADAEALGSVLGDSHIGDFAVQIIHNKPTYVVQEQIEGLFAESRRDDTLLLYYSGHGLKSESGELFLAAANTRPDRLRATAIPADFVQRCMRESRSRYAVLLLDCCYGGAFAQGVTVRAYGSVNIKDSFPAEKLADGRGRAVITASSSVGYAFEGERLTGNPNGPSVFTAAVVEGLATGAADRDEDGWVSLDELYDYVFEKVRERNPSQTPSRDVEMQGELYLARSQRRRVSAAPIPAELQAAMADSNMFTRLGAVTELKSRLYSDDLTIALSAYEALSQLARTDIKFVADAATAARQEAAVRPTQTELSFPQLNQGSPSPHYTLQLLGPPIARSCVPSTSDSWIRATTAPHGLDVSIDTRRIDGNAQGSLSLKGPTGEAVIVIKANLASSPPPGLAPPHAQPSFASHNGSYEMALTSAVFPPKPVVRSPSSQYPTSNGPLPRSDNIMRQTNSHTGRSANSLLHRGQVFSKVLWALIPVLSIGFLVPVPFIHAALWRRKRGLTVIAITWTIIWLLMWVSIATLRSSDIYFLLAFLASAHAMWLSRRVFPKPATSQ